MHFDDETLTELFKGRVVTPTVRNDVTVKKCYSKQKARNQNPKPLRRVIREKRYKQHSNFNHS